MAASIKLILTDAAGNDLNDNVTIDLFSHQSSQQYQVARRVQREIEIHGIDVSAGALCRVMITPANHRIVQFFLMLKDGATVEFLAPLPVDPRKVVSVTGPVFTKLPSKARQMLEEAQVPRFNDG